MGAAKRMSNGEVKRPSIAAEAYQPMLNEPTASAATETMTNIEASVIGPHPSTIRVSAPYLTQATIDQRLLRSTTSSAATNSLGLSSLDAHERSLAEAREDNYRLQGVTWLDNVRRALQLPIRTFTTACVYYHKFRLAHPSVEYNWVDAAVASLLTSCKNEDTLKKSRDILAAAHNLKQPAAHEYLGADDPIFDQPSRTAIGLERLVLESGAFDFRSRSPHQILVKIAKTLRGKIPTPQNRDERDIAKLAWTILTDIHRTFAPLKQTSTTLAVASLQLAVLLHSDTADSALSTTDIAQILDKQTWQTTRQEVMETLLDALDLYTHHTAATVVGTKFSLEDFLQVRLVLNKECSSAGIPRFTLSQPASVDALGSTLRVSNGHPTPVSPPQPDQISQLSSNTTAMHPIPEGGITLRFMLNPQRAVDEKSEVNRYYVEEWEEYEEEVEIPIGRSQSRDRDRPPTPRGPASDRYGARNDRRWDNRHADWGHPRDREGDRRYDDRSYNDRERGRRFDERRDRERHYYDDAHRRRNRDTRR